MTASYGEVDGCGRVSRSFELQIKRGMSVLYVKAQLALKNGTNTGRGVGPTTLVPSDLSEVSHPTRAPGLPCA